MRGAIAGGPPGAPGNASQSSAKSPVLGTIWSGELIDGHIEVSYSWPLKCRFESYPLRSLLIINPPLSGRSYLRPSFLFGGRFAVTEAANRLFFHYTMRRRFCQVFFMCKTAQIFARNFVHFVYCNPVVAVV